MVKAQIAYSGLCYSLFTQTMLSVPILVVGILYHILMRYTFRNFGFAKNRRIPTFDINLELRDYEKNSSMFCFSVSQRKTKISETGSKPQSGG